MRRISAGSRTSRRGFLSGCCACLAAAFVPETGSAQDFKAFPEGLIGCSFQYGLQPRSGVWTFSSSVEARQIISEIADAAQLSPNFEIVAADVAEAGTIPNALAWIENGKRYIAYSEAWVQRTLRETRSAYWAGVALLAHECGHHFNGHTSRDIGNSPLKELEADRFAGFAVARLGGSLEAAQSLFRTLPADATNTHPGRSARIEAVTVGWRNGSSGVRPQPTDAAACRPHWYGEEFPGEGSLCRMVRTCDGPDMPLRTACRTPRGVWVWRP